MQLHIFKYKNEGERIFDEVRTIDIEGEVWFASDIARNLGYKSPKDAVKTHCKSKGAMKQRLSTATGLKSMILINESNVYRLIIRSKLAAADSFEDWLFDDLYIFTIIGTFFYFFSLLFL